MNVIVQSSIELDKSSKVAARDLPSAILGLRYLLGSGPGLGHLPWLTNRGLA